jgi:hypothetical protein
MSSFRRRMWTAAAVVSFLTGGRFVNVFRSTPKVQDLVAHPLGTIGIALAAMVMVGALIHWGRRSENRPVAMVTLLCTAINTAILALANHYAWFGGTVVRPPLHVQMLVYGMAFLGLTLPPLLLYRRLESRSPILALIAYLAFVVAFSAASAPVERDFVAKGVYVFSPGYTMATDILWGVAWYLFALSVYQTLMRTGRLDRAILEVESRRTLHVPGSPSNH